MSEKLTRRGFVKGSILGSAGLALGVAAGAPGTSSGADGKPQAPKGPPAPKGLLPKGKIGKLEVSRMLLGGNLLTHYTHSRDLQYVYKLAEHYNTREKLLETLATAEANGIDTLCVHTAPNDILGILKEHREKRGGKMKWIICPTEPIEEGLEKYRRQVKQLIDLGVDAIYLWGVRADELAAAGKIDLLGKAVELAKVQGVPSGVGAHGLEAIMACEKARVGADFYLKTLHHHDYPSAKLGHDSMWCMEPEKTVEFMKGVKKPWIAFKTMAAGAIPPRDAFRYAIEGGADFVVAGMFDYEIAEDVAVMAEVLAGASKRVRPYLG